MGRLRAGARLYGSAGAVPRGRDRVWDTHASGARAGPVGATAVAARLADDRGLSLRAGRAVLRGVGGRAAGLGGGAVDLDRLSAGWHAVRPTGAREGDVSARYEGRAMAGGAHAYLAGARDAAAVV